jgi:hypothetical protein
VAGFGALLKVLAINRQQIANQAARDFESGTIVVAFLPRCFIDGVQSFVEAGRQMRAQL